MEKNDDLIFDLDFEEKECIKLENEEYIKLKEEEEIKKEIFNKFVITEESFFIISITRNENKEKLYNRNKDELFKMFNNRIKIEN